MTTIDAIVRTALREVAPEADLDTLPPDVDLRDTLHLDSLALRGGRRCARIRDPLSLCRAGDRSVR